MGREDAVGALRSSTTHQSRRKTVRREVHPKRQSTPRRRLQEAQLADKIYNVGGSSIESKREEKEGKDSGAETSVDSIFLAANALARSTVLEALHNIQGVEGKTSR